MKSRSNYDSIHDEYWESDIRKSGTRYERLTAFVFKALKNQNTVIHDIKLSGASQVKHQIDVTVGTKNQKKRVLIECKDFDISGKKVGLGIIRDFWGVVDDIHPDEAIVITCTNFTKNARKYAKSKGIKLAILREFQESDWKGRIKTIQFTMKVLGITEPKVSMNFLDQSQLDKFSKDLTDSGISGQGIMKGMPVYLTVDNKRIQLNTYVEKLWNDHPRDNPGPVQLKVDMSDKSIEVEKRGPVKLESFFINFEVVHSEEYFEVTSDKVAKLLISDLSDTDVIIFEDDLKSMKIDEKTGK